MPGRESTNGNPILLPASTGIEGDGLDAAAATMDLLATVLEPDSDIEIHQMTNEKQKDAFRYGSAFSRGAAIRMPRATWISISGTASIDEAGVTVFPGDFRAQMNKTLDAIEALIAQEGATLEHICDATIFIKRPQDVEAYHEVMAERGLADIAGVPMVADVCREDLLFEMDGAAVVPKS
jgi:enamine deaminase RidA (YjgF/YER057c/UK114 family)